MDFSKNLSVKQNQDSSSPTPPPFATLFPGSWILNRIYIFLDKDVFHNWKSSIEYEFLLSAVYMHFRDTH